MAGQTVLCYGGIAVEAFIELPYTPKPGIAHIICDESYRIGGGAANVAEWLGSWDAAVRLTGYAIGLDRQGDRLVNWLKAYPSIDLSYLHRVPEIDTLVSRTVPLSNGNKYLLCVGYGNVTMAEPQAGLLEGISLLDIAFYHRQLRGNTASAALARLAVAREVSIVAMDLLDPADDITRSADIIINSAASISEQYPAADPWKHCQELQRISHGVVILTDGSRRVNALDRDGRQYSLLPPVVRQVEATGAGDSFRAGMIYGHLQGWSLSRSLSWAAAVSALQVQRSLAQDTPPSREKIMGVAKQIEVTEEA